MTTFVVNTKSDGNVTAEGFISIVDGNLQFFTGSAEQFVTACFAQGEWLSVRPQTDVPKLELAVKPATRVGFVQ